MKSPFIDKSKARTFILVHSTAGGKEGGDGKRVFKEVTKPDIDVKLFLFFIG